MNSLVLDPARKVPLYMRVNRDGNPVTITVAYSNGSDYPVSSEEWEVNIKAKKNSTENTIQLLSGAGLVVGANYLKFEPTAEQTNVKEQEYYWELYNRTRKMTWLCGPAYLHRGEFDGVDQISSITVDTEGTQLALTVNLSDPTPGTWINCGTYDASGDVFPSTGGTGTSGAIKAFNTFVLSVGGTLGGVFFNAGSILVALVDNPGQTYTNWRIV